MNEQLSSTGGRIIKTKTGLIHYHNSERQIEDKEELKFSFSAFEQVKVPQWTGTSTVYQTK